VFIGFVGTGQGFACGDFEGFFGLARVPVYLG
jgi:hypothetical protein